METFCLATGIHYGHLLTIKTLGQVESGQAIRNHMTLWRNLNFGTTRVFFGTVRGKTFVRFSAICGKTYYLLSTIACIIVYYSLSLICDIDDISSHQFGDISIINYLIPNY